jgi:hypothetical protein
MKELGYPDSFYQITVTGEDLRGPAAAAVLYKFHGCALRAIEDENRYRPLLVARSAQITAWMSNMTFKIVRDQLQALIQRSRTLMIGMSAQDENIKNLFGLVGAQQGWRWIDQPTPIVFSEQELGDDQKNLLIVGVDASTMEANAALRTIVRREDGRTYGEMLTRMAQESGIDTPTADDLVRIDRNRKGKKLSNQEWTSKTDPEAKIAKLKDGRTHLAEKPEHAVDLDTGIVVPRRQRTSRANWPPTRGITRAPS